MSESRLGDWDASQVYYIPVFIELPEQTEGQREEVDNQEEDS